MYFLICCSASLTLPSEPQLFMSVQSDLYDLMFDRFEYKEQVTTCDLHDCKIPLCLTERSSLAVAHSPPDSFAVLLMHRSVNAAGSWAGPRGKVSVGSDSAALLPNPLPLGPGWCRWTWAEDSLCLQHSDPGALPSLCQETQSLWRRSLLSLHGPGKMSHLLYTNKNCEFYW